MTVVNYGYKTRALQKTEEDLFDFFKRNGQRILLGSLSNPRA